MKRIFPCLFVLFAAALVLLPGAGCAGHAAEPAAAQGGRVLLPILMYHGVLKDPARASNCFVLPVSPPPII